MELLFLGHLTDTGLKKGKVMQCLQQQGTMLIGLNRPAFLFSHFKWETA